MEAYLNSEAPERCEHGRQGSLVFAKDDNPLRQIPEQTRLGLRTKDNSLGFFRQDEDASSTVVICENYGLNSVAVFLKLKDGLTPLASLGTRLFLQKTRSTPFFIHGTTGETLDYPIPVDALTTGTRFCLRTSDGFFVDVQYGEKKELELTLSKSARAAFRLSESVKSLSKSELTLSKSARAAFRLSESGSARVSG
jgi:hypothetical protein